MSITVKFYVQHKKSCQLIQKETLILIFLFADFSKRTCESVYLYQPPFASSFLKFEKPLIIFYHQSNFNNKCNQIATCTIKTNILQNYKILSQNSSISDKEIYKSIFQTNNLAYQEFKRKKEPHLKRRQST
ncbi:hypothetical protein TTHERM_00878170 (macronuclear) [Tetrahymena thermophila SB210]|uniref:Uncharacterized protein n=1 Tax=Tetrahymena thermophila (strain SB210) TaxID=312017 RepID=Q23H24_TETTS|nr:hypothetical protein TTHERM_00878170 [Tetrahymena thermophila SB210]EAR95823.1 hypothetical protein TTHERM_00878170 [Tetrahymena thermophila SB210]|eukprot:XP_001016068.1 hypothetical protein TTHERM_00878170 [Tetrahymena thermophila SB210]